MLTPLKSGKAIALPWGEGEKSPRHPARDPAMRAIPPIAPQRGAT
jgi:hypothetical protein